jgi:hypothetical protein
MTVGKDGGSDPAIHARIKGLSISVTIIGFRDCNSQIIAQIWCMDPQPTLDRLLVESPQALGCAMVHRALIEHFLPNPKDPRRLGAELIAQNAVLAVELSQRRPGPGCSQ